MHVDNTTSHCPKCDNDLGQQHDGSTVTVDIAHQGERVHEALEKMHKEIEFARHGVAKRIRFIVGSGLIRDNVLLTLGDLTFRGEIKAFDAEQNNPGSIVVVLK